MGNESSGACISPNYEEDCKRLSAENAKLCRIIDSMSDEIMQLRVVKSTVEAIFGQKIDVTIFSKSGASDV